MSNLKKSQKIVSKLFIMDDKDYPYNTQLNILKSNGISSAEAKQLLNQYKGNIEQAVDQYKKVISLKGKQIIT